MQGLCGMFLTPGFLSSSTWEAQSILESDRSGLALTFTVCVTWSPSGLSHLIFSIEEIIGTSK